MTKATVERQIPRVILVLLRSQALSRRDIEHKKREPSKLISVIKRLVSLERDCQTFNGGLRFPTRRAVEQPHDFQPCPLRLLAQIGLAVAVAAFRSEFKALAGFLFDREQERAAFLEAGACPP
jgi:hypothetical protein